MSAPMTASATSGAGVPASEDRRLDAASTALSATAGAGFDVGAGWGAWPLVPAGAAGVVPGGTPVVAVGPGPGVVVAAAAAAGAAVAELVAQAPEARCWIASSRALGKSGAYCSMSLGTWPLPAASCLAEYAQPSTFPVFL